MFLSSVLVVATIAAASQQPGPQPSSAVPPIAIDVVTIPSSVPLPPRDLSVTVDGRPRKVISVRPILRGPGSERVVGGADIVNAPVADPTRTIVVLVDQNSLVRASEKKMSSLIARVLDLVAPTDQAALIPLPVERTGVVAVTRDRRVMWNTLGKIRVGSRAAPLALARAEQPAPVSDAETQQIASPSSEAPASRDRDLPAAATRPSEPRPAIEEPARGPIDDLQDIISAIHDIPGPKTMLVIRGTTPPEQDDRTEIAVDSGLDVTGALRAAAAARVTIDAVTLGDKWRGRTDEVARLARLTGGDEFRLGKHAPQELERLGVSMAEGVRIAIEGSPGDLDGRLHQISIVTARRDVVLRAPERWLPFEPREPERLATAPLTAAPRSVTASAPAGARASSATVIDPELQRVLARMSSYVAQYVQEFSSVVAEEKYSQNVRPQGGWHVPGPGSRELRSDFLLVQVPGSRDWSPFRDVFEVNGKPVRERDDRLRKLFIEMAPDALDKARRILDESARYNIGTTYRNVNLPVLALIFLKPEFVGGCEFRRAGEESVEGVRVWRLDFDEIGRPTVIQNDRAQRDIPATGSLWVDPITGRIVKTRIQMRDASVHMDTTVLFRRSETLHLWAPAEMEEIYVSAVERLTGRATYKNFRRFRVDVEEQIAVPKT